MKRSSRLSLPTMITLVLVLILLGRGTYTVYQKWDLATEAARSTQEEVTRLNARKAELQAQINRLQSREGVEAEIREQYQVGKPGEEVITIVESPQEESSTVSQEANVSTGFWAQVRSWFR